MASETQAVWIRPETSLRLVVMVLRISPHPQLRVRGGTRDNLWVSDLIPARVLSVLQGQLSIDTLVLV